MKNDVKVEVLENAMLIPSGLNIPIDMKIEDVRFQNYQYYGNKHAAINTSIENSCISIKINHSQVEKPFWVTIFEGGNYREHYSRCIIATFEPTMNEKNCLDIDGDTICDTDCITKSDENFDGINTIKEVLFAFKCKVFDGDDAELYAKDGAAIEHNSMVISETIDKLGLLCFVTINEMISNDNPNTEQLKAISEKINTAASGKLYAVTVVHDYCIKAVQQFLKKEDAENIFIKYCKEFYNENGLELYCERLGVDSINDLSVSQFELYFNSSEWHDVNDLANVEINLM